MAQNLPSVPHIPCQFAANGDKTNVPNTQAIVGDGLASWNTGFPPETSDPISGGGIPPQRPDFNGVLNVATAPQFYLQQGGYYTFDENVANEIGGYPQGAILTFYDSAKRAVRKLRSKVPNNYDNFVLSASVIGSSWEDVTPVMETGGHLFDIFMSISTAAPLGAHLLDGSVLSKADYPDFYEEAVLRSSSGTIPTKTALEYNAQIAAYGQCGSFVIDTVGETIQLPTLKSFVQNGTPGTVHSAGLPNISGSVNGRGFEGNTTITGAFSPSSRKTSNFLDKRDAGISFVSPLVLDASSANPIYGGANTVQPDSMEVCFYIQVKRGNIVGVPAASGGGITSGEAEQIASGATVNIISGAIVSGALVGSSGARVIAEDVLSSGGYTTSNAARQIASGVFASGGTINGATVFNSTVTINGLLTASGGAVASAGYLGGSSYYAYSYTLPNVEYGAYPGVGHYVLSSGFVAGFSAGVYGGAQLFFDNVNLSETVTLTQSGIRIEAGSDGAGYTGAGVNVNLSRGAALAHMDQEGQRQVELLVSGGRVVVTREENGSATSGNVLLDTDPLPGQSGAIIENRPFSTTVGGYTVKLTSGGGLSVSGSGASVVLSGGQIAAGVDAGGSVTINAQGVSIEDGIGGSAAIAAGYLIANGVLIGGRVEVATRLITSTVSEMQPVISVLSGGTSYVFDSEHLYSVEVSSVVKTTEASYLHFTLDSVTAPTPVVISGVSYLNSATFEGGKEYLVGFFDGMAVVNEVTQ